MNTELKTNITVKDICEGFVYNELEGKGLFYVPCGRTDTKYPVAPLRREVCVR
jgi:hypothetical protein